MSNFLSIIILTFCCELIALFTFLQGPSPPIDFQSLCNVIVWGEPFNPNGEITVYEAQFYIPDTQLRVLREIAQDRTFYIIDEEDKLGGNVDTFVRVIACGHINKSLPTNEQFRCVQEHKEVQVNGVKEEA